MNEPEKDLSEKNEEKTSFECFICLEKRFVALLPPCGHEICGICVQKTFNTEGLHYKCGKCRADLPNNRNGFGSEFHNIADLKTEEVEYATAAAAFEGALPLLKDLIAQKKFAVGDSVRVVGLQNQTDLNGSEGVITKLFATSERHVVRLGLRKKYKMKPKNLRDSKLETHCIFIAAAFGHVEIVKFFAEQNADLDRADEGATPVYHGATPIFVAAQEGQTEIVKFLAEHKADLDRPMNDGATPIFVAVYNGHTEIIKSLAKHKADLNREMNDGRTPIMMAVAKAHAEIVRILIEANANVEESLLSIVTTDEIQKILTEELEKK